MNIKEAMKVVMYLHDSYPQDRKATQDDLFQRAESYSITLADYPVDIVMKAASHCVMTSKWYPTTKELLDAVQRERLLAEPPKVTPIPKAVAVDPDKVDEYLEAFCEWIGFGCEPNDNKELPQGVIRYEQ